jgi:hypothetical protein
MSNSSNIFKMSIRTKVIFTTILSITLVLGIYAAYIYIKGEKELEYNMSYFTEATAKKLSSHLKVPLWNLDAELISEAVKSEMLTKALIAVIVYDENTTTQ